MFDFISAFLARLFPSNSFDTVQYDEVVEENPSEYEDIVTPTEEQLFAMSKLDLDKFADEVYGIKLDRRKTKQGMVNQFFEEYNKNDGVS